MIDSLQTYREVFVRLLREGSGDIVPNCSRLHAKVIIQELCRHAQDRFLLLCSNFAEDVYGDTETKNVLKEAVKRVKNARVYVKSENPECLLFAKELNSIRPGTVAWGYKTSGLNDFCVSDNAFRLERDEISGTAYVCANDKDIADGLYELISQTADCA